MGAIAMRIRSKKGIPAVQRGLASLRKYGTNVHFWTAGTGWLNGVQAANYLDSAGTTSASVDNPIGLVLDQLSGQGALGPNLATVTSAVMTGAVGYTPITGPAATVGSVYQVSYTYNVTSGAAQASIGGVALPVINGPASGSYSTFITATTTAAPTMYSNGAVGSISNYSVRQVLGIPASQATTANKPTLRRGVTNTILNSNALATGWSVNNSGVPTNSAIVGLDGVTQNASSLACTAISGSGVYGYANPNAVAGVPVTQCAVVKLLAGASTAFCLGADYSTTYITVNPQANVIASAAASITQSSLAPMGNGYYLYAWSFVTPTANPPLVLNNQGGTAVTMAVANTGQFTGTLTAQQILQCGGIPLTTTAAASSSAGNWGWQEGSAQQIYGTAPFQPSDDHVLIVGATNFDTGAPSKVPLCVGNAGQGFIEVSFAGLTSLPRAVWKDDSAAQITLYGPTASIGIPVVISARRLGVSRSVRVNGVQTALDTTTTLGASVATYVSIGNRYTTGAFNSGHVGLSYASIAIKGSVTDADLLAIERMVGALTGPTGVIF
ncbi:MAG: hypothetical protein JZU58_28410 [Curvibacter lanceolatus]|uniref:hypothetical protein n=1 Tax=Curvibacter lanceolatus TaxID=86182 RepID=UPI002352212A|nr:hypothetical protein [Curvibacter lanceolatus]MBV5296281.1 hypothetical protein [Curvibacter lanceolatus]